ncbi:phage tail assembly chaperone [Clostridium ihumii]|uniref:phage tail assembly chaperone n=1 Tax=Clostridium ihumii TaxID=1470356 RepID=UPI0005575E31|nr:hypothetical protein [Clostridium ihumii]
MEKPILYKDIEISNRKFRLKKMNARTGSYMLYKFIKIVTPIFKNIKIDNESNLEDIDLKDVSLADVISSIFNLPEEEFRYIQDNCLQSVEEILPAGPAQVLDKYGNFGVMDIEFDTGLVMQLTVQSLMFNVSGFFDGSPLTSLVKGLTISPLNSVM